MVKNEKLKSITSEYILGFTDGEGCFTLHISKKKKSPFGISLTPSFSVSQNTESLHVLQEIRLFFQCGWIRNDRKTSKYEVRDLDSLLTKVIPFFKKHQLRTRKSRDFEIFCQICTLLAKGEHLKHSGIKQLLDLAYSMNQNGCFRRKEKRQLLSELDRVIQPKSF